MTRRQKIFVEAYISNRFNATKAAIAAGYSERTARQRGSKLLTNVDIQEEIKQQVKEITHDLGINKIDVLREISRNAFIDPKKLFDEEGHIKNIKDMDEDTRRAIGSVEVVIPKKAESEIDHILKIRFNDKSKNLEMLGKNLGLFEPEEEDGDGGPKTVIYYPAKLQVDPQTDENTLEENDIEDDDING